MLPMSLSWALFCVGVSSIQVDDDGLDDYYETDKDDYFQDQLQQMQQQIERFESSGVCPMGRNPHLENFVRKKVNTETEQWASSTKKKRQGKCQRSLVESVGRERG